ncbi:MAG: deoxyribonuclease IV [bacterium]|nr:deoxyribonuclease IV [bacterium]
MGVHVSIRGGLKTAIDEVIRLKINTFQIFTHSPRVWAIREFTPIEIKNFKAALSDLKIDEFFVHTPYLPNIATIDKKLYERSKKALLDDLRICEKIGAKYLVIHPGAYSENSNLLEAIEIVAKTFDEAFKIYDVTILVENSNGAGRKICSNWKEIKLLFDAIKNPKKLGICLDTCHTFVAGNKIPESLNDLDKLIGLKKVKLIHLNDSKREFGSKIDIHEHLGKGNIGLKKLKEFINFNGLKSVALILETPKDSPQADELNIKTAKLIA